jgi:hypothetical protein
MKSGSPTQSKRSDVRGVDPSIQGLCGSMDPSAIDNTTGAR